MTIPSGWLLALALSAAAGSPTPTPAARPTPPDILAGARAQARAGHLEATIAALDQALSYGAVTISDMLSDPAFRELHGEPEFRRLVRTNAEARATLTAAGEPGTPLTVSGVVRDPGGKPILGALVYVFHTDASGRYGPSSVMDENRARLFGYLRTTASGRYEFRTIRPGGYPEPRELGGTSRPLPAHIHFEVSGPDSRPRRFQLVFADDPRLDAHWRAWADSGGHPVAKPVTSADGSTRVELDITLSPR